MSFLKTALKFFGEALAESGYSRNSVTRTVYFRDVTYSEIEAEAQKKIGGLNFLVKSEAGGSWQPVGLIRKLSENQIHFSPNKDGAGIPDAVEITRNHTGKLVARARYDRSVHVTVR